MNIKEVLPIDGGLKEITTKVAAYDRGRGRLFLCFIGSASDGVPKYSEMIIIFLC